MFHVEVVGVHSHNMYIAIKIMREKCLIFEGINGDATVSLCIIIISWRGRVSKVYIVIFIGLSL